MRGEKDENLDEMRLGVKWSIHFTCISFQSISIDDHHHHMLCQLLLQVFVQGGIFYNKNRTPELPKMHTHTHIHRPKILVNKSIAKEKAPFPQAFLLQPLLYAALLPLLVGMLLPTLSAFQQKRPPQSHFSSLPSRCCCYYNCYHKCSYFLGLFDGWMEGIFSVFLQKNVPVIHSPLSLAHPQRRHVIFSLFILSPSAKPELTSWS